MFNYDHNQIAFVFNNLSANQLIYSCAHNVNNWLSNNANTCISIFYEDNAPSCVNINTSRFNIGEVAFFTGNLICTSFNTIKSTSFAHRCKKYYYINDIEYTRSWFRDLDLFNNIIENDKIVKFFRCEDHYKKFIKDGYKIDKIIVPDFDISNILKITYDNKRN